VNKLKAPGRANIGFAGTDATVRSLIEDKLWRDEQTSADPATATTSKQELVRNALNRVLKATHNIDYKPPVAPNIKDEFYPRNADPSGEPSAQASLRGFLRFCADKYPAKHYMLFMLGHGVVVGNDIFMLDEHASESSLTLIDLGQILAEFKHTIELEDSTFELVSFHSCSVSSMEVAYELQGTAKYMLSSQGPAFVGSWPYRQILVRIFNALSENTPINIRDLMVQMHRSCMLNSADYLLAGYSFQLTLCDLEKVSTIKEEIAELSKALTTALKKEPPDELSMDSVLLSHWRSQSFFNEMYTDLYDFCFCLSNKIKALEGGGSTNNDLTDIREGCEKVMDLLVKENPRRDAQSSSEQLIVASDSLGPAFQYSRGLSIYFPWQEPSKDSRIMAQYDRYRFSTEITNNWAGFLRAYFEATKRTPSNDEQDQRRTLAAPLPVNGPMIIDRALDEDIASLVYNGEGTPDLSAALAGGLKGDPTDKAGGDYEAVSIKNFPRDIRTRKARMKQAAPKFPINRNFSKNGKTSKAAAS
ncbi:MAG TPA: clostripain-related cysteine peptidase, partial [Pyrinomonadaceae bacterium]|nr:clostripain-related cysteine peptidase [Pyrinomonadaceae bacterium]